MREAKIIASASGFSLIELMAVLLLLGIMAVVIVPRIADSGMAVVAEAEVLRTNLRFAQSMAAAANAAEWSVHFTGNSYMLQRNGAASSVVFPGESSATRMLANDVQITGGTGALVFDALGAPASTYQVTLSDGARTETVTVTGQTGFIP